MLGDMISANPWIKYKLSFFFSYVQKPMWDNFLLKYSLWGIQSPNCNQKKIILNFILKLSDLKTNFIITLDYINPALNNSALDYNLSCYQYYPM